MLLPTPYCLRLVSCPIYPAEFSKWDRIVPTLIRRITRTISIYLAMYFGILTYPNPAYFVADHTSVFFLSLPRSLLSSPPSPFLPLPPPLSPLPFCTCSTGDRFRPRLGVRSKSNQQTLSRFSTPGGELPLTTVPSLALGDAQ